MMMDEPGKRRPAISLPGSDRRAAAGLPRISDNRMFLASGLVASAGRDPLAIRKNAIFSMLSESRAARSGRQSGLFRSMR